MTVKQTELWMAQMPSLLLAFGSEVVLDLLAYNLSFTWPHRKNFLGIFIGNLGGSLKIGFQASKCVP